MRVRVILAVFAILAVLTLGGVYVIAHRLGRQLPQIVTQSCTVSSGGGSNGEVTLDPDQMANAATIAAVGITRRVPERAIVVALATAAQESKWRNLTGGDRDSIGLFQQRPSQGWGTATQIADARYATGKFYTALLKVKGWQTMALGTAAQRVQRSADADGSAYAQWEDEAQIMATALLGDRPSAVACTVVDQPTRRGVAAIEALTRDVALDWGQVRAVSTSGPAGVELTVNAPRAGWQYAHWLVAHSVDEGIKSVSFGNQRWTAKGGTWSAAPSGAAGNSVASLGTHVVAEVYPTA
jgi:hypothetical protein